MHFSSPLVTVILPTYNRPDTFGSAVKSVLGQTFTSWELLTINDGGPDVRHIVEQFGDRRIRFVSNPVNRGKAVCCNLGLKMAQGRLIAYLDDDDLWYPNHLDTLTRLFLENDNLSVAYSDLYRVGFIRDPKTRQRYPLDKKIVVSRDFNRDFLFHHNHVLHVSLMHTARAGRRVGGYDSSITAMIDWNMVRKLAFYYDFLHVPVVTGEYYAPFEVTDRISHVQITDQETFRHITRKVKADMPAGPWPYVAVVEVLMPVDRWQPGIKDVMTRILDEAPYPVTIRLLDNREDQGEILASCLGEMGQLGNVGILDLPEKQPFLDACRTGARLSKADYLVLASPNMDVNRWKNGFYHMLESLCTGQCDLVPFGQPVNGTLPDAMVRREALLRDDFPHQARIGRLNDLEPLPVPPSLKSEFYLSQAKAFLASGRDEQGIDMIHKAVDCERGGPGLASQMDRLFPLYMKRGQYQTAEREIKRLIGQGYQADNYIRLGRLLAIQGRYDEALEAFQKGLDALGLRPEHLDSPVFPQRLPEECDAFLALMGMGECFQKTGRPGLAERMFWMARKINQASPRPYLGYAAVLVDSDRLEEARTILSDTEASKGDPLAEKSYLLGKIHRKSGRDEAALAEFMKAYINGRHTWETLDSLLELGEKLNQWPALLDIFRAHVQKYPEDWKAARKLTALMERAPSPHPSTGSTLSLDAPPSAKIGRNDPCPCGSGKKYKKCCGK